MTNKVPQDTRHDGVHSAGANAHGRPIVHKAHADCPHYNVAVAATLPEAQGRGHLSTLMRAVTRRADEEGLPCYLECHGTRNRGIYMRYGFREVGKYTYEVEGDEPGSAPYTEAFAMWWPPA